MVGRLLQIALDNSSLQIQFGSIDGIKGLPALEFLDLDKVPHGWILLNVRKEPVIWVTTRNGLVRYEMVSLVG